VETNGDEYYLSIDLVCTTTEGKREVFALIERVENAGDRWIEPGRTDPAVLAVPRRLQRLAKLGKWRPGELTPIQLPLLSNYPRLTFKQTGISDNSFGENYAWTLRARTKSGRSVLVASGKPNSPNVDGRFTGRGMCGKQCFYRGSRSIAGVSDGAGGEIWWIHLAMAAADNCGKQWRTVRFGPALPKGQ